MSRAPRNLAARRNWGSDDSATPILHVDMDAFFVAVELISHPELRGKPVAVGGQTRGVIAAASYEARAFGVNSAMPVATARRRCPHLVILPPRMEEYRRYSQAIMAILAEFTPVLEQVSVDEAYLDVRSTRRIFGSPVRIAQQIRERIHNEVGVAASVGVAATKHVAKLASAHAKPDGLLLIPAAATQAFLDTLPVAALVGVGEATQARLARMGIVNVADIRVCGRDALMRNLGKAAGSHISDLACGVDPRPVLAERPEEKSYSSEETYFDLLATPEQVRASLKAHAHEVARRMRKNGCAARGVGIKIRDGRFATLTRQTQLAQASNTASDLAHAAIELFDALPFPAEKVRLVGLRAFNIQDDAQIQLTLDFDDRHHKADEVMDEVARRFGPGALLPGSLTEPHGSEGE